MAFWENELFEILSWLPAKSICKLKSICESFLDLSKEVYFCMKQAQNIKHDTCFFLQQDTVQLSSANQIEVHPLVEEESLSCGVPKHFVNFLANSARILASSNGLVLCRSKTKVDNIFICNPVTQTWLPIANPGSVRDFSSANINIVFKCNNKNFDIYDYKLILIEKPLEWSNYLNLKLYLAKEGVWEAVENSFFGGGRDLKLEMPVYLQNVLHFISENSPSFIKGSPFYTPYIMSYNFESGESTMLKLPKGARNPSFEVDMGIFEWGNVRNLDHSICLVKLMTLSFTIWVLVDYKTNLWRKIFKIGVKEMGLKEKNPKIQGFTVTNGDSLVFATEEKVYGYGLNGENHMNLREICEHKWDTRVCFTSYSNTLRPCGSGAIYFPREDKQQHLELTATSSSTEYRE